MFSNDSPRVVTGTYVFMPDTLGLYEFTTIKWYFALRLIFTIVKGF